MKLIGDLKEKVENAKTKEEARDTIKEAGMLLDDEELETVSGGLPDNPMRRPEGRFPQTMLLVCHACEREVAEWDTFTPLPMDPCPHCYEVPNPYDPWKIVSFSRR